MFALKRPCALKFHFADFFDLDIKEFLPEICNDGNENPYHGIFIYPNPNKGNFKVRFVSEKLPQGPVLYNIYDALGQLVYSEEKVNFVGANFINFELNGLLSTGNYFLQVVTKDFSISEKISISQ
jgi:hypothetical protein